MLMHVKIYVNAHIQFSGRVQFFKSHYDFVAMFFFYLNRNNNINIDP